jgi:hypothetical protein
LPQHLWWPIKILLLIGTGGGIYRPGFASVGLLGGLIYSGNSHRAIQNGVRSWLVVRNPINLLLTLFTAVAIGFLYKSIESDLDISSLLIIFAASLVGAILLQFLDFEFYKRTGASLISLNILMAYIHLLMDSNLPVIAMWLISGILLASVLAILVYMTNPKKVSVEMGYPPRQGVLVPLPRIDCSFARGLGIFTFIALMIGTALWDLAFPKSINLSPGSLFIIGLALWLAGAEIFYRINSRITFLGDIDPLRLSKVMARQFWTISGVGTGRETEKFLKSLLHQAQRRDLIIVVSGVIGLIVSLLVFSAQDLKSSLLIVMFPLFVVVMAQFIYSAASAVSRMIKIVSQQVHAPMEITIMATPQLYKGLAGMSLPIAESEREQRLIELVMKVLPKEEREELARLWEETGLLRGVPISRAVGKLIITSLKPSPGTQKTIDIPAAREIMIKTMQELLLHTIVIFIIGAVAKKIFSISQENTILLIIGIIIPLAIPATVANRQFRTSFVTLFVALIKKLRGARKSEDS